jgi:hypothetical protein
MRRVTGCLVNRFFTIWAVGFFGVIALALLVALAITAYARRPG